MLFQTACVSHWELLLQRWHIQENSHWMKGSFLRELCIFIIHGLRKGSLCKLFYSFWPEVDVSSSSILSIKTTFLQTEIWNRLSTCCMTHAAAVGRFSRLKTQFVRERSETSRAGGREKWSWRLNLALLFRLFYYNSFWEWYVLGICYWKFSKCP